MERSAIRDSHHQQTPVIGRPRVSLRSTRATGFELQTSGTQSSNSVIARRRVGAKRRPMTGSAKQSMRQQRKKEWIASSLAMTLEYESAISPLVSREFCHHVPPF
jgi:hypothetical protein